MYGFEGDPGREGEVFTRIPESTYRRLSLCPETGVRAAHFSLLGTRFLLSVFLYCIKTAEKSFNNEILKQVHKICPN